MVKRIGGWLRGRLGDLNRLRREQPVVFYCMALSVVMISPYLGFFASSMLRELTLENLKQLLLRWQTQTAGIFAVLAALIGAAAVHGQTTNARRMEEERRTARALSIRVSMAPVVSSVMEFTADAADWLNQCRNYRSRLADALVPSTIEKPGPRPELDREPLAIVSTLLEVSPSDHARPWAVWLNMLQILEATLRQINPTDVSHSAVTITEEYLVAAIVHAVEVYARTGHLLAYVRGAGLGPPECISPETMRMAVERIGLHKGLGAGLDRVDAEIRRRTCLPNWPES